MRIVRYWVAYGETHDELNRRVRESLAEGWVPLGGVSSIPLRIKQDGYLEVELIQAMVKYEADPETDAADQ